MGSCFRFILGFLSTNVLLKKISANLLIICSISANLVVPVEIQTGQNTVNQVAVESH